MALLFKDLATLRTDAALFGDVDELRWRGPTRAFAQHAARIGDPRLMERVGRVSKRNAG
jgi:5'-3' exonuclease